MRVMFAVSDYLPHYFPMVPLGWALQAAGHEVRVVCAPGQTSHVEGAGLTPVPILEDVDMLMWARLGHFWAARDGNVPADLDMPVISPADGAVLDSVDDFDFDAFLKSIRGPEASKAGRRIDAMVDFARRWHPDLVIHDVLHLDAVVAAKVLGVPAICHLTGPIGTQETGYGLNFIPEHYSRAFDRHGVQERGVDLIDHVIDICPVSMAPPTAANRLPVRYIPYNGPGAMPAWAARKPRRPRICVMWSQTLSKLFGPATFAVPLITEALADLDVEVVVTVNAEGTRQLGKVPDNVRLLEHCPVHLLLATADALVHAGGAGSTLTAVAAGVPQLFVTFGPEYRANGQRLAATGAGLQLHGPTVDAETIRKSVLSLLEDQSYGDHANRLRQEMLDRPTPAQITADLSALAGAPLSFAGTTLADAGRPDPDRPGSAVRPEPVPITL